MAGLSVEFTKGINPDDLLSAVATGLNRAANNVAAKALPLTPMLEGDLRGSQQVTKATATDLTSTVSYDTPYAVRRHEEMGVHFTEPGTQAKYLEQPFEQSKQESLDIIAEAAREALK